MAFFGLLTVYWDLQVRRELGAGRPFHAVLLRDALPAFLSIVVVGFVAYLVTWTGWLVTDGGYDRDWAATNAGWPLVPDALRSLAEYHRAAWAFHVGLDSPHSYKSSAWSWPVMSRPTSFYYESPEGVCGADRCAQEVLALGNPIIWWAGLLALFHNAWRAVAGRDWRSGALLVGYLAGWLPWMVFHGRTIFTFYAIVLVPFLAGMLAISLASLAGGPDATADAPAVGDPGRGDGPAARRRLDLVLPAGLDRAGAALRALGLAHVAAHLGLSGRAPSLLAGLVRHHGVEHRPLGRSRAAGHQRDGLLARDALRLERRHPCGQPGGVGVAAGPAPGRPGPRA